MKKDKGNYSKYTSCIDIEDHCFTQKFEIHIREEKVIIIMLKLGFSFMQKRKQE